MIEYSELHCHSYYSLLDATSSPAELAKRAASLGINALALTDHDNLYGALEFANACRRQGIKAIHGAELTLESGAHLTLLVRNRVGWQNLCALITQAQHNAPKGQASLPLDMLSQYSDGLIALSGCDQSDIKQALMCSDWQKAEQLACNYRDMFGASHFWLELQDHQRVQDHQLNQQLLKLAKRIGVDVVATNNVHYARREQHRLQDVLVTIQHNTTLDAGITHLRANSEYYLKSPRRMNTLFKDYPQAIANTQHIVELCDFELHPYAHHLPEYPRLDMQTAQHYLRELCLTSSHYDTDMDERLNHELQIIHESDLDNYFLVVWDVVRFAHEQGIRCQGRGSAANSLVAYLLNISVINPLEHDLVFERFLSAERQLVPDIDIDFDAVRREEVIQYIYSRYGLEHAAMACTFITFRARSAVRDVGKALGLSPALVDTLAKSLDRYSVDESPLAGQLRDLCEQIHGLPRHLGIHNGGMIITEEPLKHYLPTEPASMEDRYVVQWDKESLEDANLIKIDILGLRMLSAIDEASRIANVTPEHLSYDDPTVYDMICNADTVGVFQVESRAQMQMLPRFRPRNFADLIVAISLIRPGPIQGDMVHPYLRRRLGEEKVDYLHPSLKPALEETLGVILFQEQVLKVAHDFAGFTAGQGELLRRALGKKDAIEALRSFEQRFMQGAQRLGRDETTTKIVFSKLLGFGSYSFPKSHAASFAVLVYQSAWLRCYHPTAFFIALLNNQPMGFYSKSVIVNDARRYNIDVLPVHVNHSEARCTMEQGSIRLGFNMVKGCGEHKQERIISARQTSFISLADFCRRTGLSIRLVENLIQAGAMDVWDIPRRDLLWELGRLRHEIPSLELEPEPVNIDLPEATETDHYDMQIRSTGVSVDQHVMAFYREWLDGNGILSSEQLAQAPDKAQVQIAGQVVVRQAPPTAKGFRFLTLEDEFGIINVIVRPNIYDEYREVIRGAHLLMVSGEVQHVRGVVNVVARHLTAL